MKLRDVTHAEFVHHHLSKSDKMHLAIDSKKLLDVFISLDESKIHIPDELMSYKRNKLMNPLKKYQKNKASFWIINILLLLTPLRFLLLGSLVFAAVMHLIYRVMKMDVLAHMACNEAFFKEMTEHRVIIASIEDEPVSE
ncbi:hypothetical protein LMH73_007945 [Vibrio splendidus]|nr:hypothetical protein [Vibrio splendidus]MCC4883121.1 hypothetical protein [Vibrio splendidus]